MRRAVIVTWVTYATAMIHIHRRVLDLLPAGGGVMMTQALSSAFVRAAAQVRVTIQTARVQIRGVQRHVQFIAAHHFETGVDNSFLNIDGKLFYCAVPPPAPIRAGAHVISG